MNKYLENEKLLKKELEKVNCGDIIYYSMLEKIIGYERNDTRFYYILARVRYSLISKGYVFKCISNSGYIRLKPNEISDYVYNKMLNINDRTILLNSIVVNTPKNRLSVEEKAKLNIIFDLTKETSEYINSQCIHTTRELNSIRYLNN